MKGTRILLFLSPLLWFVPPLVPVLGLEMLNGFYKGMLGRFPRDRPAGPRGAKSARGGTRGQTSLSTRCKRRTLGQAGLSPPTLLPLPAHLFNLSPHALFFR